MSGPLSHYMPVGRFEQLLKSRMLWLRGLAKASAYGEMREADLAPMQRRFQVGQICDASLELKGTFCHCWTMGTDDKAFFWGAPYFPKGMEGRGVCICSTAEALEESVRPAPFVQTELKIVRCLYEDRAASPGGVLPLRQVTGTGDLDLPYSFVKETPYAPEEEVRLVAKTVTYRGMPMQADAAQRVDDGSKLVLTGLPLPVDLARLIHAVRIGPGVPPREIEVIRELVQKQVPGAKWLE